jgi:hypothetical protein
MRQGLFAGDDAEVHVAGVGLDGDVQRQPVHHDGQRVEAQEARAGQVERDRWARHVGDRQVGHHGQAAGHATFAVGVQRHFGRTAHQPGRQQRRIVRW